MLNCPAIADATSNNLSSKWRAAPRNGPSASWLHEKTSVFTGILLVLTDIRIIACADIER